MATREKNVVQGALIVCVIFLLFSLVGNFFLFQSYDAAVAKSAQASDSSNRALNEVKSKTDQVESLKRMIGFTQMTEAELDALQNSVNSDPEMAEIEKKFTVDMALLPSEEAKQNRNYRYLPQYLMQTIRQRNEAEARNLAEINKLGEDKKEVIKRETNARKELQTSKEELQTTLENATESYQKDRDKFKIDTAQLVEQKDKMALKHGKERQELNTQVTGLQKDVEHKQETIDVQREKITDLEDDEFESAQGVVTFVFPLGERVMINLGSADQLRTGLIFGVLDPDDVKVSRATPKAHLEVVRINSSHLSEARVVAKANTSVIISDRDPIYTPFWEPGRKVKVALAGFLDVNGDNRNDQDEVRALIQSTGAEVVAMMSTSGVVSGKIDHDTRFVVVGTEPKFGESDAPEVVAQNANYISALGNFKDEAKKLGVTTISLNKLLGWLRALGDAKTVPLGGQARAEDFPYETAPGTANRVPTNLSDLYDKDK